MNVWSGKKEKENQPVFTGLFRNYNRRQSSENHKYSRFCRALLLEERRTLYSCLETYDSVLFARARRCNSTHASEGCAAVPPAETHLMQLSFGLSHIISLDIYPPSLQLLPAHSSRSFYLANLILLLLIPLLSHLQSFHTYFLSFA